MALNDLIVDSAYKVKIQNPKIGFGVIAQKDPTQ